MKPHGLVSFDIDGTLVRPSSSSSFLASRFGHQGELDQAEKKYADGDLSNRQVSNIDAAGWKGTPVATVDDWLADLPLINGIEAVVTWCRTQHLEPVLASLA